MLPLLGLITGAAAEDVTIMTYCGPWGSCTSETAMWHSILGHFRINANEGCRDPPDVPYLNSICFDWGNQRAHFFYDNHPKRCLQQWTSHPLFLFTSMQRWREVACTW
ncbi:hypothetical protein C8A05DRAFT_17104 [Staphylotrichum tortipilum]|uniref:Uncharacterized protein n=1 Tax=Staphylotrichum tortipilum TaxID=2831512 RepID=A0AAN6RSK6_9PEZI|nr:hypothetical protein C8A05DRAFT_17104 [Staphylotrichum longicolle]